MTNGVMMCSTTTSNLCPKSGSRFEPMELDGPHTRDYSRDFWKPFQMRLLSISLSLWFMVHINLFSLQCSSVIACFREWIWFVSFLKTLWHLYQLKIIAFLTSHLFSFTLPLDIWQTSLGS